MLVIPFAQGVTFVGASFHLLKVSFLLELNNLTENRRNIYKPIVLEHAQVEGKPMNIFNKSVCLGIHVSAQKIELRANLTGS